uniref:Uncharacterized protein n=1 Tax=Falco tinnunculus TaxID=100819 RepID=A0A8C4UMA4_FALTI
MAHFETQYQRLESSSTESPPGGGDLLVHVPEGAKSPWHHIENLDLFFSRISFGRAGFRRDAPRRSRALSFQSRFPLRTYNSLILWTALWVL